MVRRHSESARRRASPAPGQRRASAPTDRGAQIALAVLAVVILASAFLVDPRGESSYDAPKRLATLLGTVLAAAALLICPAPGAAVKRPLRQLPGPPRVAFLCFAAALAGAALAAIASPKRPLALDSLRVLLVLALLVPIGASRALARGRARALLGVFVAACTGNVVVSILQTAGWWQPFAVESHGGRVLAGAFLGNEGYVALSCALAGVAALVGAFLAAGRRERAVLGAVALCCLA
ncbi:MAG: hypothetical protein V1750_01230, partial [Acidobacteriota bacterium]